MPIYIEGICKRLNHEANIMVNIVGLFITQNVHYLHFKFLDQRASSTAVWSAFFFGKQTSAGAFFGQLYRSEMEHGGAGNLCLLLN